MISPIFILSATSTAKPHLLNTILFFIHSMQTSFWELVWTYFLLVPKFTKMVYSLRNQFVSIRCTSYIYDLMQLMFAFHLRQLYYGVSLQLKSLNLHNSRLLISHIQNNRVLEHCSLWRPPIFFKIKKWSIFIWFSLDPYSSSFHIQC